MQPRDPEARFTADGRQVTSFRMVCSHVRRGRDGERVEEADWFQVSTFGRLAETTANLVTKGSRVLVEVASCRAPGKTTKGNLVRAWK